MQLTSPVFYTTSFSFQTDKLSSLNGTICNTKRNLNLGPSRLAVFEDCKVTSLSTKPPRLVNKQIISFFLIPISVTL